MGAVRCFCTISATWFKFTKPVAPELEGLVVSADKATVTIKHVNLHNRETGGVQGVGWVSTAGTCKILTITKI